MRIDDVVVTRSLKRSHGAGGNFSLLFIDAKEIAEDCSNTGFQMLYIYFSLSSYRQADLNARERRGTEPRTKDGQNAWSSKNY